MTKNTLPISEALRFGWEKTIGNIVFWLVLFAIIFVISIVLQVAEHFSKELSVLLHINLVLVGAIFESIVHAGFIAIALKFCDGQKPDYPDFICSIPVILKFILASLLYGLIVFVGLLLLIVPGIIWAIKYFPILYLVVDKDKGPLDALSESAQLTDGVKGKLFLLGILFFFVNLLGFAALFVGLLITVPMTMLATAFIYRHLLGHAPAVANHQPGLSPHIQRTS